MRALFVYKYLTLGGVETLLGARLEGLGAFGVEAEAWFLSEGDGAGVFRGLEGRIHIGGIDALRRHLGAHPQDVISSIDTDDVLPTLRELSAAVLLEVHSPYLENLDYLRRLDGRGIAGVLVPSEHQKAIAQERLGWEAEIRVIPNALARHVAAEPAPFHPVPPRAIVAWVGRLDPLKDWRAFVSVARAVGREFDEVEFWMVSPAPAFRGDEDLFRSASRAGIASRIIWFQSLAHRRVVRLMDAVRDSGGVVLSTSRGESFGMAIAEGMARSCAVVAPALGPFPEYIADGKNGLLYAPRSAEAAAAAVARFLRDPALRDRCAGRARRDILSRHAPAQALQALADALQEARRGAERMGAQPREGSPAS